MKVDKQYKNKMGMFDFIKGVAIFAVVFCHTVECWDGEPGFRPLILANGILGACWMPAFLLSSAYWYKPKPVKSFTRKQLSNFIIPFLRMEVIAWGFFCVIHYMKWGYFRDTLKGLKSLILGTALGNMTEFFIGDTRICNVGPMWFVLTLCFSGIIFNFIMNQDRIKNKLVLILPISLLGVICGKVTWQVYCFSAVFAAVLGHYVGYMLKESKFLIRKWTGKDYALIWGVITLCYVMVAVFSSNGFYCNAVYITFGIPMGIMALRIGLKIGHGKENFITMFFKRMGRYTFWILMVHTVEVLCIDWHWFKEWHVLAALPSYMNFLIVLLIRLSLIACGCFGIAKASRVWTRVKENVISKRTSNMEK